jgi:hypothetical protein
MVDLFQKSDLQIHKFGCGELLTSIESRLQCSRVNLPKKDSFLSESLGGPSTDTSNMKVATLSTTLQNWSGLRILCGLSSLILTQRQTLRLHPNGHSSPPKILISATPANFERHLNQQHQTIYQYQHSKWLHSPYDRSIMTAHPLYGKTYMILPSGEDNLAGIRLSHYLRLAKLISTSLVLEEPIKGLTRCTM